MLQPASQRGSLRATTGWLIGAGDQSVINQFVTQLSAIVARLAASCSIHTVASRRQSSSSGYTRATATLAFCVCSSARSSTRRQLFAFRLAAEICNLAVLITTTTTSTLADREAFAGGEIQISGRMVAQRNTHTMLLCCFPSPFISRARRLHRRRPKRDL